MKRMFLLTMATTLCALQPLAFDVASVKPNTSGRTSMSAGRDSVNFENHSLRQLIQVAYRVKDYAYSGPSWLDSVHFDVVGKLPAGAKFNQFPDMLQTLLADRFKLAVHREEKVINGLALVLDKKGLRIAPVEPGISGTGSGRSMFHGKKITMAEFADGLSNVLQHPVKDLTGVSGLYDIDIKWLPDSAAPTDPADMPGSVYAAVQELGLKLQVQRLPVETLVVDHAERVPIEN